MVHMQDGSVHRFLHIAQDNFYRNLTSEEQADIGAFNFDHPAVSSPSRLYGLPGQLSPRKYHGTGWGMTARFKGT